MNIRNEDSPGNDAGTGGAAVKDDAAKPRSTPPAQRRSGFLGRLVRLILLLAIIGGLAAAGWYGWQWLRAERARYIATVAEQGATIAQLQAQFEQLAETRVAQDEFEELRDTLLETQSALRDRVNAVAGDMQSLRDAAQGGRRDLLRAEVEYLLRIAADALYLGRDVDTALYALQAADDRLRQLAEPRLMPVRQLIANHLQALNAVNVPDVNGMALKLGSLMQQAATLPLRQTQHARAIESEAAAAPSGETGWWARMRAGFARLFDQLVVVQRAAPPPPLLAPEQHFFLYRNVELQLAAARTALLAGDATAYRQSLEIAREWLNRYFDSEDPAVAGAIADISGLLDVPLQPALPDINPALERFRALTGNDVSLRARAE